MLNDLPTRHVYTAAPAQTDFDYDFVPFDLDFVVVTVEGVPYSRTAPGGGAATFSIAASPDAEGGTAVLGVACVGGERVVIERNLLIARQSDFPATGPVPNSRFDREFDYEMAILQDLATRQMGTSARALLVPDGEAAPPVASLAGFNGYVLGIVDDVIMPVPNDAATAAQLLADAQAGFDATDASISVKVGLVDADAAQVTADKAIVAADRAATLTAKGQAEEARDLAISAKDDALSSLAAAMAADRIYDNATAAYAGTNDGQNLFLRENGNLVEYINVSDSSLTATGIVIAGAANVDAASEQTTKALANMGEDVRAYSAATIGSTTPNSSTIASGNIALNLPGASQQGIVNRCSVRLDASGTGKLLIVNTLTSKVTRTIATVSANASGVNSFDFDPNWLNAGEVVAYQTLTGGRVRYAAGSGGRYIANADWDGTDGDSVTIASPGSFDYAISYRLYAVPRNTSLSERVTLRRKRGGADISSLLDVMECWLDSPGDTQTNLASPGVNDINLATPTSPNVTKTGYGVKLRAGLLQTASITCRTVITVCRVDPETGLAFIISGGTSATQGITTAAQPSAETVHIGAGAGVHPLWHKSSDGSRAHELLAGGWMIIFRDMGTSRTSIFGFGGRHSHASADRVSEMDIAMVGASTLALDDAQRSTIANAIARRLLDQGVTIFNRDCREKVYGIMLAGDSSVEGRGRLYNGNASVTATTASASRDITVTAVSGGALMPQMSLQLASIPGTAIIESQISGTTGGTGVYRLNIGADSTAGAGKTGVASHYGVDFTSTLIMTGTGSTVFRDLDPLALGINQQNEVPSALASPMNAGVAVGIARWRRINALGKKRRICIVGLTRGSSHICPFGTITPGSSPAPDFTYHPSACEDAAATASAGTASLFELFLRQWYRASAQARNRGLALEMDALVVPGGLQSTSDSVATGGSAAAFQAYIQAFFDAVKLYTSENPKAVVYQSQTGASTDPTLTGYVRDGQLAFKNANSGAVLYDTDISVPSSGSYAGAPHGLNAGDLHLNLYSVLKQGEAAPTLLGWA